MSTGPAPNLIKYLTGLWGYLESTGSTHDLVVGVASISMNTTSVESGGAFLSVVH